jgi:hypothetical protein
MEILKGKQRKPWLATIYGVPGIGKSTLATFASNPIFVDIEGGLNRIDCDKTPKPNSLTEFLDQLRWAFGSDYDTVVIDTLLALNYMIEKAVLEERGADSLKDSKKFPYDLAKQLMVAHWSAILRIAKALVEDGGKNVLFIGHSCIETVKNPSGDNYERNSINMNRGAIDYLVAEMDAVLFATYEKVFTSKAGSEQKSVSATGTRLLFTTEKLHCIGKNRMALPERLTFNNSDECRKVFELLNV